MDFYNSLFKFNLRKLQCILNSAARIISITSRYTSITPVLKKLHWLPVEHRSVFKTATLVYKFLRIGFPQAFCSIYLFLQQFYSTRRSQSGNFLVISKFQPSVHKSVKQFGYSFAFDAPTGMLFLMRFVHPLSSLLQKTPQNLPVHKGIPSLVLLTPGILCGAWSLFCPWIFEIGYCFCSVTP